MWILQRTDQGGGYVSDPRLNPGGRSYTRNVLRAKMYRTEEEARADSCVENETPVNLTAMIEARY